MARAFYNFRQELRFVNLQSLPTGQSALDQRIYFVKEK
jgi:hypothetical protein